MSSAFGFRDAELRSLRFRALNRMGELSVRAGRPLPSLDPESIVAAAQKRAGSNDMGSDSYVEPLTQYLASAENEAQLTTFGRLAVRGMLVSALANRIELHGWATAHPEIREESIEAPWVIVGLPRTGTSLLSILLGLDPTARTPLQWEAAKPIPPPGLSDASLDPRIAAHQKQVDGLLALNPPFAAMHPTGATLAQECVAFFMYDIRTLGIETQALVPSYGRWLETADMTSAYAQHRTALQALQAAQPTERWVLKTPNHLWCLPDLLVAYPDARIVWTHRDPGPVVTSLASLVNTLQRLFTDRRDPRPTAEEWKHKAHTAIDGGMAFDDQAAAEWCVHLQYQDLVADPVGAVTRIYESFDAEVSPLHRRRMDGLDAGAPTDGRRPPRLRPRRLRLELRGACRGVRALPGSIRDRHRPGVSRPGPGARTLASSRASALERIDLPGPVLAVGRHRQLPGQLVARGRPRSARRGAGTRGTSSTRPAVACCRR